MQILQNLNGSLRLTYTANIVSQIFGGNPAVYFGWTSGGTGNEYVRVLGIPCLSSLTPTGTPSPSPTLCSYSNGYRQSNRYV